MLVPYQLPSVTFSASGVETVQLKLLPKQLRGRIAHLSKFIFEVDYTPTYTTAPTTVGNNNVFTACDFWDGRINRFVGGFNHMRAKERMELGRMRLPDADTDTASASARYFRRVLHVGPAQMAGSPSDFLIPCGALENGELRITMGALADLSADTTVATGTVRIIACLELLDEVRIPPAFQFMRYQASGADQALPGRSLAIEMGLLNSSSFDAIAANDFGNIRLDFGQGDVIPSIPSEALNAAYQDDYESGSVETFQGEPRGATDDNNKIVNRGTPTALAAAANDLQMVYWPKKYDKLTKQELVESEARLQWDGAQSTGVILYGRILSQPPSVVGAIAAVALASIGRTVQEMKVKTLSKKPYTGPLVEFMPYSIKV